MANLHGMFVRVAVYELSRRRGQLGALSGPEFDDLAQQAADDALVSVLAKLGDFRGLSRFTTWAYKFVVFEVSGKVARHAWRRQPPGHRELVLEHVPDSLASRPGDQLERREQLEALSVAIRALTDRQREGVCRDRAQRRADRRPRDPARRDTERDLQEPVRRQA